MIRALLLIGLAGCGGIGAGDYVVIRVGFSAEQLSDSCWPDRSQPVDLVGDSSSFLGADTLGILVTSDKRYMLDVGDFVLEGSKDGSLYTFAGESIDVEFFGGHHGPGRDADRVRRVPIEGGVRWLPGDRGHEPLRRGQLASTSTPVWDDAPRARSGAARWARDARGVEHASTAGGSRHRRHPDRVGPGGR